MTDTSPTGTTPTAAPATEPGGPEHPDDRAGREPGELVVALSPRQIIGGFALLAGLIIWLRRRSRTRRRG